MRYSDGGFMASTNGIRRSSNEPIGLFSSCEEAIRTFVSDRARQERRPGLSTEGPGQRHGVLERRTDAAADDAGARLDEAPRGRGPAFGGLARIRADFSQQESELDVA